MKRIKQFKSQTKISKILLFTWIQLFTGIISFSQCLPAFQYNADGNMITKVQFNTIDNTSPFTSGTTPVYENFTSISTSVAIGETYPVTVKGPSSTFPSDVMVYIDWNQNGDFDEPGIYVGLIAAANPANALSVTADVFIPANALPGNTKMRIVKNTNVAAFSNPLAPNTISSACDQALRAGQTEDYTIHVLPAAQNCSGDPGGNVGDLGCVSFTYNGVTTDYTTVRAADGNIWLQQNLGSQQMGTSATDAAAYGDLFQWGRWDDGLRTSAISTTALAQNDPTGLNGINSFIGSSPEWWENGASTDTWNAEIPVQVSATNGCDPCKALGNEWQLPSTPVWQTVIDAEGMTNVLSAFESNLKMVVGGTRNASGTFDFVGVRGSYWTSTTSSLGGKMLYYSNFIVNPNAGYPREQGGSIRCVKMAQSPTLTLEVSTQNSVPATIATNAGTLQLQAIILPAAANQQVYWSIVNTSGTATISTTGLVTAQTNGIVWAKAVSVDNVLLKDSIAITISGQIIPVQSIDVVTQNSVPATIATNAGTLQLQANILPTAANQQVYWSIVNTSGTATISTTGLVTAQANGIVWAKAVSVDNVLLKDSLQITISGQPNVGINENSDLLPIQFYPNPVNEILLVTMAKDHPTIQLILMDMTGKVILQQEINENQLNHSILSLDLSGVQSGIYYIRFSNGEIHFMERIIKR